MRLPADIRARNQTIDHFIVSFAFFTLVSSPALSTRLSDPITINITAIRERRIDIFVIHLVISVFNPPSTQRFSFDVTIVVFELEKQEERDAEISVPNVQEAKLISNTKKEEKRKIKAKTIFFISKKLKS
jgi:hypothetical protein